MNKIENVVKGFLLGIDGSLLAFYFHKHSYAFMSEFKLKSQGSLGKLITLSSILDSRFCCIIKIK
jgi:hypothetical protein